MFVVRLVFVLKFQYQLIKHKIVLCDVFFSSSMY